MTSHVTILKMMGRRHGLRKAAFMLFCLSFLIEVDVNAGKVLYLLNDKFLLLDYSTLSLFVLSGAACSWFKAV